MGKSEKAQIVAQRQALLDEAKDKLATETARLKAEVKVREQELKQATAGVLNTTV